MPVVPHHLSEDVLVFGEPLLCPEPARPSARSCVPQLAVALGVTGGGHSSAATEIKHNFTSLPPPFYPSTEGRKGYLVPKLESSGNNSILGITWEGRYTFQESSHLPLNYSLYCVTARSSLTHLVEKYLAEPTYKLQFNMFKK